MTDETFTLVLEETEEVFSTDYTYGILEDVSGRTLGDYVIVRATDTFSGTAYSWVIEPTEELLSKIGDTKEGLLRRIQLYIQQGTEDIVECNPKETEVEDVQE